MTPNAVKYAPLCSLLLGLLLGACGGLPEAGVAPSEEPLGTQESALCAGLSVTNLTITGVSSYGGVVSASGSWTVSLGANAVRLEYYVNGVMRSSEERTGTTGTWYFSEGGMTCATHTFMVKAYPMVIDSGGTRTTCWSSPNSKSQNFTQGCPTATLSCSRTSSSVITCTGSGSGGTGSPYTAFWQLYGQSAYSSTWEGFGWYQKGFTETFYCPQTSGDPADRLQPQFKVRDNSGMDSAIRSSSIYLCQPGTAIPF